MSLPLGLGMGARRGVAVPVLSNPIDEANGATAATGSADTDKSTGTLWWVCTTSSTAPTATQIKAGQDDSGNAAASSGSQAVSATGTQTLSPAPSGLTSNTAYTIHFYQEAVRGSNIVSGDGFTTAIL